MNKKIILYYNENVNERLLVNFDFFGAFFSSKSIIFKKQLWDVKNPILVFNGEIININIFFNILRKIYMEDFLKKKCTTVTLYEY